MSNIDKNNCLIDNCINDDDDDDDDQIGWDDLNLPLFLMTSSFVSVGCDAVLYPFDLIKTRLQTQNKISSSFKPYRGTLHACTSISKNEGMRGFYKGFGATVAGAIPADILFYGTYEFSKNVLQKSFIKLQKVFPNSVYFRNISNVDPLIHMFCGGLAEVTSAIIWIPYDIVAQKLMVQGNLKDPKYKNAYQVFRSVLKHDGIRGLYRGSFATLLTFGSESAFRWAIYEYTRKRAYRYYNKISKKPVKQSNIIHIICGTFSGGLAALITNPIDVIKTKLQVQDYYSKHDIKEKNLLRPKYKSTLSMAKGILKEEGILAFSKGVLPRVLYSAPVYALTFFLYETVKKYTKKDT
eukprot:TRINITY_DN115_c4_g1_i1.p1 TRINITY_DN115_c4_g1~~TRINITY_DN115_c4_g1_i1.p1  ORF type:complete len:352 (+),score=54.93 TRINITY_DN115_c4_g1_i1:98-1153(+)